MQNTNSAVSSPEEERRRWLDLAHREVPMSQRETLRLSSHGLLLQLDAERAFVAGAWASVVVMCQAVIEARVRELDAGNDMGNAAAASAGYAQLERIRNLRDELLHPQAPRPQSLLWGPGSGNYISCHAGLEDDAKSAMLQMIRILYSQGKSRG